MSEPHYSSAAHNDLVDILNYISQDDPAAAISWVEKIEAKCLLIAKVPTLGERQDQWGEGVRSSLVAATLSFTAIRLSELRFYA